MYVCMYITLCVCMYISLPRLKSKGMPVFNSALAKQIYTENCSLRITLTLHGLQVCFGMYKLALPCKIKT